MKKSYYTKLFAKKNSTNFLNKNLLKQILQICIHTIFQIIYKINREIGLVILIKIYYCCSKKRV